ncbi:dGTP triphosphohydrolase [Psychroflexus lacisalsi]|uniref:Deoxyguanosinetriphosphate triphosphohydrolase n=1 Tax=Psychroflexus lacisalsi TaxID=503928 RepID=A0ABN1K262_9FLAO|nr:dNTP triphosphohydrolase [Psychroflexus lacisalsi]MBZ9621111.1 dNTP triphosphohydrolase [Psychroflexus lacisalsi]
MPTWESLLSLKRQGDTNKRIRKEQDDTRLGFEVDYDRVIFSSEFRSLQDKTQVIPLSKTDFVHTRLTHSLEVSVVGRSLGRLVGKKVLEKHPQLQGTHGHHFNDFGAIVAAAALAHDIGNPPFGHSGERAIGDYFKFGNGKRFQEQLSETVYQDLSKFEGNANGFKLLTNDNYGSPGGLRLSYATLGAFTKYPKASLPHKPTKQVADKKFGFFHQQVDKFQDVAEELGLEKNSDGNGVRYKRHPLAFLVEAADDICYTIIDFEDGINLGLIQEEFALEYLSKIVHKNINTKKYSKLSTTKNRISYLRSLAIGALIEDAVSIFMENEEAILKGDYHHALMDKSIYKVQIEDIIKISVKNIYQSQEVLDKEIAGYKILTKILDDFTTAVEHLHAGYASNFDKLILKNFLKDFNFSDSKLEDWLIDVCSFVASLTDSNALRTYRKLTGSDL